MPSLNNDIIKDIFAEISKSGNPQDVEKLYLNGKECLNAFHELLRHSKAICIDEEQIIVDLKTFKMTINHLPWRCFKEIALRVQKLSIKKFWSPDNIPPPWIRCFTNNDKLQTIEFLHEKPQLIVAEVWNSLITSTIQKIKAPYVALLNIPQTSVNHVFEEVKVTIETSDDESFSERMLDFGISFKHITIVSRIDDFGRIFLSANNKNRRTYPFVETLTFKLYYDIDLYLPSLFESFEVVFPNLKKAEIFCYEHFVNYFSSEVYSLLSEEAVDFHNMFLKDVNEAEINYKLCFTFNRHHFINWEHYNPAQISNAFQATNLNFVMDVDNGDYQGWVTKKEISDTKSMELIFDIAKPLMNLSS